MESVLSLCAGGHLPAGDGPAQGERAGPGALRRHQEEEQAHHPLSPVSDP